MNIAKAKRLKRSFFNRPTLQVAEALLGKVVVFNGQYGIITETEAYFGDDPASHAAKGETPRTKLMFGEAGHAYVYLIYGMYYCLNFVTEKKGFPAAVLIRGVQLLDKTNVHLNGPGKLCRYFGITKEQNGVDIIESKDLYVLDIKKTCKFSVSPRIGIKVGLDKHWRFLAIES